MEDQIRALTSVDIRLLLVYTTYTTDARATRDDEEATMDDERRELTEEEIQAIQAEIDADLDAIFAMEQERARETSPHAIVWSGPNGEPH
jgi:hypothetical protein